MKRNFGIWLSFLPIVFFSLSTINSCKKDESNSLPILTTTEISDINWNTAISGGNITSEGGSTIIERGVCWSTSQNPVITDNHTSDGTGKGIFTSSITGLRTGNTYFARAYATNIVGTAYGQELSFVPDFPTISDIDGNVYKTIKIGTQTWMAENLRTTKYNDGTAIPNVTSDEQWDALATGAYCNYNNTTNTDTIATYGRLYNWYTVNTGKLAPTGWHVPTDAEWTTLTNYLGGTYLAGGKLKETGTTHWFGTNTGGTNETGFTALPGGSRSSNGTFDNVGSNGYWWSATTFDTIGVLSQGMYNNLNYIYRIVCLKEGGISVRCIKD
jgi:uncharacterized protein (TIGR02145 family)